MSQLRDHLIVAEFHGGILDGKQRTLPRGLEIYLTVYAAPRRVPVYRGFSLPVEDVIAEYCFAGFSESGRSVYRLRGLYGGG